MSMPNIPNITPEISLDRCEVINLLLSSIALEEIGLSHILNAEGEKIQYTLKKGRTWKDYLRINDSVNVTLRTIVKSQMLLQFKLEDVITLNKDSNCNPKCRKECRQCCDCEDEYAGCACGIEDLRSSHQGNRKRQKHCSQCCQCRDCKGEEQ